MIRHIATGWIRKGVPDVAVDELTAAILALEIPGMIAIHAGPGLALRPGDATYAVVADFEDEAAFRSYDEDPRHNEIRATLAGRLLERSTACQITIG